MDAVLPRKVNIKSIYFVQKPEEAGSRHDIKETSRGVAGVVKVGAEGSYDMTNTDALLSVTDTNTLRNPLL